MAADWTALSVLDAHATQITELNDRFTSLLKVDPSADSNVPDDSIRVNTTTKRVEKKSGASWDSVLTDYDDHIGSTANPHSVTPAQIGAALDSALSSHIADLANPHAVSAAQAGAFAIASNLSEGTPAAMRTSLGLGTLATLSVVTSSEISGAVAVAKGGTGGTTQATGRSGLAAAKNGSNSDITQLNLCTLLTAGASQNIQVRGASGAHLLLGAGGSDRMELDDSNNFFPTAAGGINLGTSSNYFNGVTATTFAGEPSQDIRIVGAGARGISFFINGITNSHAITSLGKLQFIQAMGDSSKNPAVDAAADWVEILIGATTYYLPAYAA